MIGFGREEIPSRKNFALHGQRDPNGGICADCLAMKFPWRDSNDFVRRSQNADFAAKDVARAAEAALPEAVADHGDRIGIPKRVYFLAESSAENGSDTESRKIRPADKTHLRTRSAVVRGSVLH